MPELTLVTALGVERRATGAHHASGMGRAKAQDLGARLATQLPVDSPVAIAGIAGALVPGIRAGDVLVATEVHAAGEVINLPAAELIATELRRTGLHVHTGPLASSTSYVRPRNRSALRTTGAVAVDMESAWLARALGERPLAVVRTIADGHHSGPVFGGARALSALLRVRPALERWARASGTRTVVLASPRSFCAGVERAIDIVERALERFGAPVYVRRQIVHNTHVVTTLETKGAIFVEELDEVPDGATVVLAAHGVSPVVRRQAEARADLAVIDATCPLVARVHQHARRFATQGIDMVLIGHGTHEEVIGTIGEAPERISLVSSPEDVARLELPQDSPVGFLTQTTLATDETAEIVEALRGRFHQLVGPGADDICYATQNRQNAVRALAASCDLILVVGSANSSNTARLVEVARREGCRAELVEDLRALRLSWLEGTSTIGITAGASAPDILVHELLDGIRTLGPIALEEVATSEETVHFSLPAQVR
jgi:4-hydroxy-3-methylbut-2-en-1-yl diphosphate reductase